jgi:hypothetical protein
MTLEEKRMGIKKWNDSKICSDLFTQNWETIIGVNFETETIFYYVSVPASCGCCSNVENREDDLNSFLENMCDEDFD